MITAAVDSANASNPSTCIPPRYVATVWPWVPYGGRQTAVSAANLARWIGVQPPRLLAYTEMRAVVITRPGGPEVLEIRDVDTPRVGREDLLVRVRASGLNRADIHQRN